LDARDKDGDGEEIVGREIEAERERERERESEGGRESAHVFPFVSYVPGVVYRSSPSNFS